MYLNRISLVLLTILLSCSTIKNTTSNNCFFDKEKYAVVNDISSKSLISEYRLFYEFLNIEDFKNGPTAAKDLVKEFFEYSEEEYEKLNFTFGGKWCKDELNNLKITSKKGRDKKMVNHVSLPILNNAGNKAFMISARNSLISIIFLKKNERQWVIVDDIILIM